MLQGAALADSGRTGFGLYVHWPFCRSKCPYCDFNSHVGGEVDHGRWARALVAELRHFAGLIHSHPAWPGPLTSIFFGGGTPSLMAPATVAAVIEAAAAEIGLAADAEITLEANPTSAEAARFRSFRRAGVNRVSLGVQALDEAALRFLGREHGVTEALAAVDLGARIFKRQSFDLIYARPEQTPGAWQRELERALDHASGHLSAYQLTIEPGTRFGHLVEAGRLPVMPDDLQAELFKITQEVLENAGLPAYEISNHAQPGEESRHNLTYWRAGEWIGIGPGAHGRLTFGERRIGTSTLAMPRQWLEQIERRGHGEVPREVLSPADRVTEVLMMGLRLGEGIPVARIEAEGGRPLPDLIDERACRRFEAEGWLQTDGGRLRTTPRGRLRLNGLILGLLGSRTPGAERDTKPAPTVSAG